MQKATNSGLSSEKKDWSTYHRRHKNLVADSFKSKNRESINRSAVDTASTYPNFCQGSKNLVCISILELY